MRTTYKDEDVTLLLKDITGLAEPLPGSEREKRIQSGTHYCEMLPLEYEPTEKYMQAYYEAVRNYSEMTAEAAARVSRMIVSEKGSDTVLVSLARAGTSAGVLIKRYIKLAFGYDVPHYSISIIRGRGIDKNALNYITERHGTKGIQFIDGWTGKGAIKRQLDEALRDFPDIDNSLAVLSDPARTAEKSGTTDDFLIASSCLNSTVSGLISRTFLRSDIIGEKDFHGAAYYGELRERDLTYHFIDSVCTFLPEFRDIAEGKPSCPTGAGLEEAKSIAEHFGIDDINLVKPGIGEATRVLLRRVPWKILVNDMNDEKYLGHIFRLAQEKGVPVEEYPLENYRACGLIRKLADS